MSAALSDLLAALAAEGTVDSEGGFTLDRDKAREKMRHFQLADPLEYLLHLVRAAVHRGATAIEFAIDTDDMWLSFDGDPFSVRDFDELYGALFAKGRGPELAARRHLALGLNAALALDPRHVIVESGGARLEARPRQDDDYGPLEPPRAGTRVHVRDRFRMGHVVRFFSAVAGTLPERRLLEARCAFCPVPISIEGAPITRGLASLRERTLTWAEARDGQAWVVGGHVADAEAPGVVTLVASGVTVRALPLDEAPGFVAVAQSPALHTDVSQADVVRDAAFDTLMGLVEAARLRALEALLLEPETIRGPALDREARHAPAVAMWPDRYGPRVAQALRARALWVGPTGARLTPGDVDAEAPGYLTDAFADRVARLEWTFTPAWIGTPVLADLADFLRLFPHAVDRTEELASELASEENRRAWRRRWVDLRLEGSGWLARQPIEAGATVGEVGLHAHMDRSAVVRFALQGCVLAERRRYISLPGVEAILHGPFTPTARFSDVEEDAAYDEALDALVAALPDLVRGFADVVGLAHAATVRRWLQAAAAGAPWTNGAREATDGPPPWFAELSNAQSADPLARLPLFETTGQGRASFADLAGWHAADGLLFWVDEDAPPLVIEPPLVRLDPEARALVSAVFGPEALRSGTARYAEAAARAAFYAQPMSSPTVGFDDAQLARRVPIREAGYFGELGLRSYAGRRQRDETYEMPVQLWVEGRPVTVTSLRVPLPSLVMAVEHEAWTLGADAGSVEGWSSLEIARVAFDHLSALLGGAPVDPGGGRRRLTRTLLDLVMPSSAHRDAWDALRAHRPGEATAAWMTVLRHGWTVGEGPAGRGLRAALEAGGAPDPAELEIDPAAPRVQMGEALLGAPFAEGTGSLAERLLRRLPVLRAAPLFKVLEGPAVGLGQLLQAAGEGPILYASRTQADLSDHDGLVLAADSMLERLQRLIGPHRFLSAHEWTKARAADEAWEHLRPAPAGLPPRELVAEEQLGGGSRLGLRVPFPEDARSRVVFCARGRIVLTETPLLGAPVQAVLAVRGLEAGPPRLSPEIRGAQIRRLEEAIPGVLADAAAGFERMRGDRRDAAWRHILHGLGRALRGKARRPENLERDPSMRRLAEVAGFRALGRRPVSLLDLSRQRAARKPIWLTVEGARPTDPEALLIQVDAFERAALKRLFGVVLPEFAAVVAEANHEARFRQRPVDALTLPPTLVAVEVAGRGIRGRLGLVRGQGGILTVHKFSRRLGEARLRLGLPGLVAVIDDDRADPNDDWDGVKEGPRLDAARAAVAGAVDALLAAAVAAGQTGAAERLAWAALGCAFPSAAWARLLFAARAARGAAAGRSVYQDALRCLAQDARNGLKRTVKGLGTSATELADAPGGPRGGRGDALIRALFGGDWPFAGEAEAHPLAQLMAHAPALADFPLVRCHGPDRRSLRGLLAAAPEGLVFSRRPTTDTPAEAVLATGEHWALLEALLPGAWRDSVEAEREARRARLLSQVLPLASLAPASEAVVVAAPVRAATLSGVLGLRFPRPADGRADVAICKDRRPVARLSELPVALVGAVEVPAARVRWAGDAPAGITEAATLRGVIGEAASSVFAALAASWPRLDEPRREAGVLHLFARLPADAEILEAIPCLASSRGPLSIAAARELLDKDVLRLADDDEEGAPAAWTLLRLEPRIVRLLTGRLGPIPPYAPPRATPVAPPVTVSAPEVAAPAAPTLEIRVRDLLRRLRPVEPELLSDVNIDLVHLEPGDGRSPARCEAGGVILDARHPIIRRAVEMGDPVLDAFVASAAFTAINLLLEPVTDAHEVELHVRLATWLASRQGLR